MVTLVTTRMIYDLSVVWIWMLVAIFLCVTALGVFQLSLAYFHPVKSHGDRSKAEISITFDDGPLPSNTEKILDILATHGTPATFFCIGSRVGENPEILKQIESRGHLVGNHTFTHSPTIGFHSTAKISRELHDTDEMIFEILEKRPRYFRPPFGITNPMIGRAVKQRKYVMVGWSLRSFDTIIKDSDRLFRRTARSLKPGDIVLFHDYSDSMIEILPRFLKLVSERGLRIVPLNQLLNEKPYR